MEFSLVGIFYKKLHMKKIIAIAVINILIISASFGQDVKKNPVKPGATKEKKLPPPPPPAPPPPATSADKLNDETPAKKKVNTTRERKKLVQPRDNKDILIKN
jgi:hypothetical protein